MNHCCEGHSPASNTLCLCGAPWRLHGYRHPHMRGSTCPGFRPRDPERAP